VLGYPALTDNSALSSSIFEPGQVCSGGGSGGIGGAGGIGLRTLSALFCSSRTASASVVGMNFCEGGDGGTGGREMYFRTPRHPSPFGDFFSRFSRLRFPVGTRATWEFELPWACFVWPVLLDGAGTRVRTRGMQLACRSWLSTSPFFERPRVHDPGVFRGEI
jgi:hypothetical protein